MAAISPSSLHQSLLLSSSSQHQTNFHSHPPLFHSPQLPPPPRPPPSPTSSLPIPSISLSKTPFCLSKSNPRHHQIPFSSTSTAQFTATPDLSLSTHKSLHQSLQSHLPTEPIHKTSLTSTPTDPFKNDFFNLLRLSVRYSDSELAKAVHASFLKLKEENTHLGNALIAAYVKLGSVPDSYKVFLGLSCPNVVSYSALISGFAKSNREYEAIELFSRMRSSGIEPSEYSFVAVLSACIRVLELELGSEVHALVIKMGYLDCIFVANALMGLYSKCGRHDLVIKLFDEMPTRDIASWNTVISGLVKERVYDKALELFHDMQRIDGFRVDQFSLSTILTASAGSLASMEGREVHGHALKIGFESNLSVNNALIGFYTKCGKVEDVVALFERMPVKDVITWTELMMAYMEFGLTDLAVEIFDKMPVRNCVSYNALLSGFCRNGEGSRALDLFSRMVKEGVELTESTLTSVVNACGLLMEAKLSKQIQGFILKFGIGSNASIEAALIDMCTRCGRMADAEKLFSQQPYGQNDSVIWTSMFCGYARDGQLEAAISLFNQKQLKGTMVVDEVESTAVLGVCGTLGFGEMGKQIHCHALKSYFLSDLGIGNALISMYYKCGNMNDAIKVFHVMPTHDIVSWNGLMTGHLLHRQGNEALAVWSKMEEAGIKPDTITFVLMISAYRHTNLNLVDQCRRLFFSMKPTYDIEPTSEHYAAFVGVLGYWDFLEEAEEIINKMPIEPKASVWRALLDASRIRLNIIIGKRAAKHILATEPQDPSTYVLVSNLYSASERWHCSEMIRGEMREKGFKKHPARSWIIHQKKVHSFYARDKSHSQTKDIYSGLEIIISECKKAGYVPDTSFVLHEVEEQQKEDFLFCHSAKLAVTYGLLMRKPGRRPIRVMKNILLCGDCHSFFKFVSVVAKREIFLRDTSGFHCFKNGQCSCKDYW